MKKRFQVIAIPDNEDGAFWFVRDSKTGHSVECVNGPAQAREMCKLANEVGWFWE